MIRSRRAVVYLVLVFLLGLALGTLGALWVGKAAWSSERPRRHRSHRGVEWLDRELNLSGEQREQVEAILDEMGGAYRAVRERVRPEYNAVRQQGREKIRALLSEEQRTKFEQLVRQIDKKEAKRREKRERHKRENQRE